MVIRDLTIALVLSVVTVACVTRTPCDQTLGAHHCSMVPQQVTCECDGRIEPARDDEQPMACGHVQTMCVGDVKRERIPAASTFDLLRVRTPSGGQDGGMMQ